MLGLLYLVYVVQALVYMTVCFEEHTVTVVALDAAAVEPPSPFMSVC